MDEKPLDFVKCSVIFCLIQWSIHNPFLNPRILLSSLSWSVVL